MFLLFLCDDVVNLYFTPFESILVTQNFLNCQLNSSRYFVNEIMEVKNLFVLDNRISLCFYVEYLLYVS